MTDESERLARAVRVAGGDAGAEVHRHRSPGGESRGGAGAHLALGVARSGASFVLLAPTAVA
jgi:hypothetical protein